MRASALLIACLVTAGGIATAVMADNGGGNGGGGSSSAPPSNSTSPLPVPIPSLPPVPVVVFGNQTGDGNRTWDGGGNGTSGGDGGGHQPPADNGTRSPPASPSGCGCNQTQGSGDGDGDGDDGCGCATVIEAGGLAAGPLDKRWEWNVADGTKSLHVEVDIGSLAGASQDLHVALVDGKGRVVASGQEGGLSTLGGSFLTFDAKPGDAAWTTGDWSVRISAGTMAGDYSVQVTTGCGPA